MVSIVLVIAVIFAMGGFHLVFKCRQYRLRCEIKQAIKLGVPDSNLIDIVITKSNEYQLEWIEGHEFRYKGMMYDVVRSDKTDSTIVYHCINDEQESLLFEDLDELVQKATQNNNKSEDRSFGSYSWLHQMLQNANSILTFYHDTDQSFGIFIYQKYSDPGSSICAPPPDYFFF